MLLLDRLARRLLIPRQTDPPFDLPLDARQDARDATALAGHVLDCPLVGCEEREELHRQDRLCGEKMLGDRFVRHRARAHPFETRQATLERFFVVLARPRQAAVRSSRQTRNSRELSQYRSQIGWSERKLNGSRAKYFNIQLCYCYYCRAFVRRMSALDR